MRSSKWWLPGVIGVGLLAVSGIFGLLDKGDANQLEGQNGMPSSLTLAQANSVYNQGKAFETISLSSLAIGCVGLLISTSVVLRHREPFAVRPLALLCLLSSSACIDDAFADYCNAHAACEQARRRPGAAFHGTQHLRARSLSCLSLAGSMPAAARTG